MAKFKLGEKNVQLMCQGKMHPPPMFSTWLWGKKPNRTILNTGDKLPGFHASEENLGNDKYKLTLDIDEVTSDLFTKFKLEVENDIGITEEIIRLTREEIVTPAPTTLPKPTTNPNPTKGDGKSEPDTGVASRRTASVWTLIMSVATIVGATMLSLSTS
ncbi:hypothetical protein LSAT2_030529 [Lamellibrachia satsuma]|nr:hypothetical protein LSAT2_030529 [Lamellibrachia satsuma]